MGYAVFHRDEAGTPTVEDVASLEEALEIVERSRNGEGPQDVRVFREVPIAVRTYYKVHVAEEVETPTGVPADTPTPAAHEVTAELDAVDQPVVAEQPTEVVGEEPVVTGPVEEPVAASATTDDPYDVRRLLEPASPDLDADRPAPPPLPGAFPLAGPAVSQPTVEVHAANLEDDEGTKRHSLFGRGG